MPLCKPLKEFVERVKQNEGNNAQQLLHRTKKVSKRFQELAFDNGRHLLCPTNSHTTNCIYVAENEMRVIAKSYAAPTQRMQQHDCNNERLESDIINAGNCYKGNARQ